MLELNAGLLVLAHLSPYYQEADQALNKQQYDPELNNAFACHTLYSELQVKLTRDF